MSTPEIVANPRQDLLVTAGNFRESQQTTYSGRLLFGDVANGPKEGTVAEFTGLIPLPDSFSYKTSELASAVVSADFWAMSTRDYLHFPSAEARFVEDPRRPGTSWLHLGMQLACNSGSIIGYRVTVLVGRAAVV